jgi:hypothetical protein
MTASRTTDTRHWTDQSPRDMIATWSPDRAYAASPSRLVYLVHRVLSLSIDGTPVPVMYAVLITEEGDWHLEAQIVGPWLHEHPIVDIDVVAQPGGRIVDRGQVVDLSESPEVSTVTISRLIDGDDPG